MLECAVLHECRYEYYTVDSLNELFESLPETCIVITIIIIIILFFAPPAPFVGYINWTCHYITDKELINLPWFLAPFAPDWMFAVSWSNPQHLFLTRTLPRSHVHFWNPTMDLTSWLGSSNWLWNALLVCVSVFHILGCNKEFIYVILFI